MSAVMKIASCCFALFLAFCAGCSPVTGLPPEEYELKQCVSRCDSKKVLSPLSEELRTEIEPLRDFHVLSSTKDTRPVAVIDIWGGLFRRWRTFLLFEKEIVCIDFGRRDNVLQIKKVPLPPETSRSLKEKLHRLETYPGETCLCGGDIPMGLFTVGCGGKTSFLHGRSCSVPAYGLGRRISPEPGISHGAGDLLLGAQGVQFVSEGQRAKE